MEQIFALVFIGIPFALGIFALCKAFGCPHLWQVIERGTLYAPGTNIRQGKYLVKECYSCHKMKTETTS